MNVLNQKKKKGLPWFSRWFQEHRRQLPDALATLTDEAGHVTNITFEKRKTKDDWIDISLVSIAYDGTETSLKDTELQYKWNIQKRSGKYLVFAAEARERDERVESHYRSRNDKTYIMAWPIDLKDEEDDDQVDARPVRKVIDGMTIVGLVTEKGTARVVY